MKKAVSLLWAAGLTLSLTSCGGVEKDASYETVQDLRTAVIDSGGACPGETSEGQKQDGEVLIRCSDELTVRWFTSDEEVKMGKMAFGIGIMGDQSILSGPNWIVQGETDELAAIQESLGGELSVQ